LTFDPSQRFLQALPQKIHSLSRPVLGCRVPYLSGSSSLGWIPFTLVKCVSFGQYGPDGARHFVGQRGNHHIEMPALQQPLNPATVSATAAWIDLTWKPTMQAQFDENSRVGLIKMSDERSFAEKCYQASGVRHWFTWFSKNPVSKFGQISWPKNVLVASLGLKMFSKWTNVQRALRERCLLPDSFGQKFASAVQPELF
jgi:hypothetical protein